MADKILVIEDEADIAQVLEFNFRQAGYHVTVARDGQTGLKTARGEPFDLVILDLMLPDLSGTDVCKALKSDAATRRMPVIMLTAKGEEIDRVVGFELGADDYVTKPFSVRELLLRVQVVLRRQHQQGEAPQAGGTIEFGCLRVDRSAHRVFVSGVEIELTSLELKLLTTLWERRNRVQSRAALLEMVWGISADINTRTVDTHVKRLREKLGDAANYIETVRGVGYRFAESPDLAAVGES